MENGCGRGRVYHPEEVSDGNRVKKEKELTGISRQLSNRFALAD
jgi:hypothetical protein